MGLFDKFKLGLGKSSSGLSEGFKNIFSKKNIDDGVLTEFEELIISSDAGVDVARELRKDFENFKIDKKLDDHKEILKLLADKMAINLLKYEKRYPEGKESQNRRYFGKSRFYTAVEEYICTEVN